MKPSSTPDPIHLDPAEAAERLERIYAARQKVTDTKAKREEARVKFVNATKAHQEAVHAWELLASPDPEMPLVDLMTNGAQPPPDPEVSKAAATLRGARQKVQFNFKDRKENP